MIVIILLECLVRFNLSHKILYLAALCHCNRSIVEQSLVIPGLHTPGHTGHGTLKQNIYIPTHKWGQIPGD